MSQTVQIKHISGDLSALNALQIGVQSTADSDLGYKMWGGKDAAGTLTQWLGKDLATRVKSLVIKDMIETGAATGVLQINSDGIVSKGTDASNIGKILVSSADTTPGYLYDKMESTTLTLEYSVDSETGNVMLDVNVVNAASGYPNNYEPFFPIAGYKNLSTAMYSDIASTALTRGFFFVAPRSMTVSNIGIYLKGDPSPSGLLQIELAIKDVTNNVVKKTATMTINTANFESLASGEVYPIPLTESFATVGTHPYILYLMLKSSDGTTPLSSFSNLNFMEICDLPAEAIQLEAGIYSQYSSQNFEGYGDTNYSNTPCRPYMFISE